MINTRTEWNQLIEPLLARSSLSGASNKFSDNAADLVLKRLGVNSTRQTPHQGSWGRKNQLTRWVDNKACAFFNVNPTGLGIEVDSGISTRFHRLSGRVDWPRFNWLMLNTPSVTECLKTAFPEMDNFRNLASENPESTWLDHLDAHGVNSVFTIIGEAKPLSSAQLTELLAKIGSSDLRTARKLELIVFYEANTPKDIFTVYNTCVAIKQQWTNSSKTNILSSLLQALFKKNTGSTKAAHLEVLPKLR